MIARSLLLALVTLAASPSPSPAPSTLKPIANVKSTPYCTNVGQHFNRIVQPMLANDVVLDRTGVSLDNVTESLNRPDFALRFSKSRTELGGYVDTLMKSLPPMQAQINELRAGERLTSDPKQASSMHMLAQELQRAYDKQRQLTSDLHGVLQAWMDFDPNAYDPTSTRNVFEALSMPRDMKDIKAYLRFDGQRDVVADAENKAGDLALTIVDTYCTLK